MAAFVFIVAILAFSAFLVWVQFALSRYHAVKEKIKEKDLLGGIVKLILWEPNEGLIILKNKSVKEIIDDGQGGTKYIFPIMGEELRARVPLTLRLLIWQDDNVLTRESLQIRVKLALWWKISNLRNYVFGIDPSLHSGGTHQDIGVLESAEAWLKTVAESTLRIVASQMSIALLVSSKATVYLDANRMINPAETVPGLGAEPINDLIQIQLSQKLRDYGLELQRVEIQDIALSPDIQQAIEKVWKSTLLPVQSEQEARARQIELQSVASVLGVEATALNEVMKNFHGTFFTMPQFMESLFSRIGTSGIGSPLPGTANQAALPKASSKSSSYDLIFAAFNGDLTEVRRLINSGMDVNSRDPQSGATPLIYAVTKGFGDVVLNLIASGANAELTDTKGLSAYDYAKSLGHTKILQILESTRTS